MAWRLRWRLTICLVAIGTTLGCDGPVDEMLPVAMDSHVDLGMCVPAGTRRVRIDLPVLDGAVMTIESSKSSCGCLDILTLNGSEGQGLKQVELVLHTPDRDGRFEELIQCSGRLGKRWATWTIRATGEVDNPLAIAGLRVLNVPASALPWEGHVPLVVGRSMAGDLRGLSVVGVEPVDWIEVWSEGEEGDGVSRLSVRIPQAAPRGQWAADILVQPVGDTGEEFDLIELSLDVQVIGTWRPTPSAMFFGRMAPGQQKTIQVHWPDINGQAAALSLASDNVDGLQTAAGTGVLDVTYSMMETADGKDVRGTAMLHVRQAGQPDLRWSLPVLAMCVVADTDAAPVSHGRLEAALQQVRSGRVGDAMQTVLARGDHERLEFEPGDAVLLSEMQIVTASDFDRMQIHDDLEARRLEVGLLVVNLLTLPDGDIDGLGARLRFEAVEAILAAYPASDERSRVVDAVARAFQARLDAARVAHGTSTPNTD